MFFFFQAEDGIRDTSVTGVQTCALPILYSANNRRTVSVRKPMSRGGGMARALKRFSDCSPSTGRSGASCQRRRFRSEERRVGKEGRVRWLLTHEVEIDRQFNVGDYLTM